MAANYSAKSADTGNVYHCTSKAEHVRLLAQGYTDVTEKQQQQQSPRQRSTSSETKSAEAKTEAKAEDK